MNRLVSNLLRFFDLRHRRNVFIIFCVIFLFKILLLILKLRFIHHGMEKGLEGFWGVWGGDTNSYINPFENLKIAGNYTDGYRMPLYGFAYFLIRIFAGKIAALNGLILLQTAVSSLSIVFAGKVASELISKKEYSIIAMILCCLSFQVMLYDWYLLPQSLVTSFLIFFTYNAIRYFKTKQTRNLFFSFLFGFLILFLYPVFFGVLFFLIAFIVYSEKATGFRKLLYVSIPFLLILGLWTYRNYRVFDVVNPLTPTYHALSPIDDDNYRYELANFSKSIGIDICAWQPKSEIRWFQDGVVPLPNGKDGYDESVQFPFHLIANSSITVDSLLDVKKKMREAREDSDPKKIDGLEVQLNRYTSYIKKEKPFLYYVSSRLRMLKLFFNYKGNDSTFFREGNNSSFIRLLKPLVQLFYCSLFFISLLFPLTFLKKGSASLLTGFLVLMYLYVIFIFPVVFKLIEHRYFSSGFPFVIIVSLWNIYNFQNWRKAKAPAYNVSIKKGVYA